MECTDDDTRDSMFFKFMKGSNILQDYRTTETPDKDSYIIDPVTRAHESADYKSYYVGNTTGYESPGSDSKTMAVYGKFNSNILSQS